MSVKAASLQKSDCLLFEGSYYEQLEAVNGNRKEKHMKNKLLTAVPYIVVLIIFNIIFFLIGGADRKASEWIAYGSIHAACLVFLAVVFVVKRNEGRAELSVPLTAISGIYYVLVFIVNLLILIWKPDSVKGCVIAEAVLAGIYMIVFSWLLRADLKTGEQIRKEQSGIRFVRGCSQRIRHLMGKVSDRAVVKKLERVYDYLHASSVQSCKSTETVEREILGAVYELEMSIETNTPEENMQKLDQIMHLAMERNDILKINNQ